MKTVNYVVITAILAGIVAMAGCQRDSGSKQLVGSALTSD